MICICGPWDEETYHPKDINKDCPVHGEHPVNHGEHPVNGMKEGPAHLGPECCGGGTLYGHESFCDVGHVKAEKADRDYVDSLRKSIEDRRAYTDHLTLVNVDLKRKLEAVELVILCAQDIVDGWPTLTFRTIAQMTKKVDTLKQALEAVK